MMKTFNELKASAKIQIKGKIGILFAMFFIMIVIMIGVSSASSFVPVLGSIANYLVNAAFALGGAWVFLRIAKGEEVSVGNIFYGFEDLWAAIKAQFFMGLFILLYQYIFFSLISKPSRVRTLYLCEFIFLFPNFKSFSKIFLPVLRENLL